jgi:mono/diheme cytochrome c family protein
MRPRDLIIVMILTACGAQQRGEPHGPPVAAATADDPHGRALFQKLCYKCHPGGAAGLGPALNNKPLPEVAVRTQIRKGVGAMPSFGPDLLGDADVAAVARFVHELRSAPHSTSAARTPPSEAPPAPHASL